MTLTPRPIAAASQSTAGLAIRRPITVLLVSTISLTLLAQVVSLSQGWT